MISLEGDFRVLQAFVYTVLFFVHHKLKANHKKNSYTFLFAEDGNIKIHFRDTECMKNILESLLHSPYKFCVKNFVFFGL